MTDNYSFEQHGNSFLDDGYYGLRNFGTIIDKFVSGKGQPFDIRFYNKPKVIEW